jgi:hypothetical protein
MRVACVALLVALLTAVAGCADRTPPAADADDGVEPGSTTEPTGSETASTTDRLSTMPETVDTNKSTVFRGEVDLEVTGANVMGEAQDYRSNHCVQVHSDGLVTVKRVNGTATWTASSPAGEQLEAIHFVPSGVMPRSGPAPSPLTFDFPEDRTVEEPEYVVIGFQLPPAGAAAMQAVHVAVEVAYLGDANVSLVPSGCIYKG